MITREEHQEQIKHMDNMRLLNHYESLCWSIGHFDATCRHGEHSEKEKLEEDTYMEILRRMEGEQND
jgi:hypothetical protein